MAGRAITSASVKDDKVLRTQVSAAWCTPATVQLALMRPAARTVSLRQHLRRHRASTDVQLGTAAPVAPRPL